jgi:sporulation protein YlmC with PRC-barrel domain
VRTLHLSELLKRPVTARDGESLGRLPDVVARLRGSELPLFIGGVASVEGREVLVPIEQVSSFDGEVLKLTSAKLDLRHFERRPGEVLLGLRGWSCA